MWENTARNILWLTGGTPETFGNTDVPAYKAMLAIIEQAKDSALKTPRVDMPGAKITPGKCRELEPLTPPKLAER